MKCVIVHNDITAVTFHILFTFHFINWNRLGARKWKNEMAGEFSDVFYVNALKFSVCFLMYILLIYVFPPGKIAGEKSDCLQNDVPNQMPSVGNKKTKMSKGMSYKL